MTTGVECAFVAFLPSAPDALRTSAAGKPWLSFNCGVGEGDAVQWVRVACFGPRAVELSQVLVKGSKVYVEGRLTLQTWTGKDGQQRHGLNVAAWRVEVLGQIGRQRSRKAKPVAPAQHGDAALDDPLPDWGAP
jgi:single-strand DNA-binding protein